MNRHSPGPWKVADSGVRVDFPDGGCCILWPNTRASNEEIKAVLEANARLIAAAPELLEAMERGRGMNEELERLKKENAALGKRLETVNRELAISEAEFCDLLQEIKDRAAERDEALKRVAELEAEPEYTTAVLKRADEIVVGDVILGSGMIRAVTNWAGHPTEYRVQIMCDEWGSWFDPGNLIAVLRQPLVEAKTVADAEATKRPFEDPWLIRCRNIVRRLVKAEDWTANEWWHLVVDAKQIWAEIQREAKGGGE